MVSDFVVALSTKLPKNARPIAKQTVRLICREHCKLAIKVPLQKAEAETGTKVKMRADLPQLQKQKSVASLL